MSSSSSGSRCEIPALFTRPTTWRNRNGGRKGTNEDNGGADALRRGEEEGEEEEEEEKEKVRSEREIL